jgi:polar amino acid transport system substrate-binding protein
VARVALHAACLLVVGSLVAQAAWSATLEDIRNGGRLHIAVYREFAPFADGGQGIDVDVARALAEAMGLAAEVKAYPEADSVDGDFRNILWRGHPLWRERLADVMMHVPVDPRLQAANDQVLIVAPYFRERLVVARNRNAIPQLVALDVFTHEKIGVQVETAEDMYLMQSFGGSLRRNVVHFGSTLEAVSALRRNEVAAVMGRETHIEAGLAGSEGHFAIAPVATPGLNVSGWDVGVAVKSDNPELAAALAAAMEQLHRSGAIERIFAKRGLTYRPPASALAARDR